MLPYRVVIHRHLTERLVFRISAEQQYEAEALAEDIAKRIERGSTMLDGVKLLESDPPDEAQVEVFDVYEED